jgi:hypothetical protein
VLVGPFLFVRFSLSLALALFLVRSHPARRVADSLSFSALFIHRQIGTFVVAFGLEHYMHHKYHAHHDEDHHHHADESKKGVAASPKEFSAETASLDEITKEMTRLRERVGELRKEGKHV